MKMMVGFPERSPCACVWMRVLTSVGQHDKSLGRLGAQQSLNSCIDVSTSGNERLEVGLTINEAHGIQLLQLLLESHFRTLRLQRKRTKTLEAGRGDDIQRGQKRLHGEPVPSTETLQAHCQPPPTCPGLWRSPQSAPSWSQSCTYSDSSTVHGALSFKAFTPKLPLWDTKSCKFSSKHRTQEKSAADPRPQSGVGSGQALAQPCRCPPKAQQPGAERYILESFLRPAAGSSAA